MKKKAETQVNKIQGVFFFDPEDRIYRSHFPGKPVVPGSVILHAFLDVLRRDGAVSGKIGIEKFRFHDFITPGHFPFSVTIEEGVVFCDLYDGEKSAATGRLKI